MSETLIMNSKSKSTSRKSGKTNGFDVFSDMCKAEYRIQFPTQDLTGEEFQKKCSNRWKNMTKKEKEHFYKISREKV